MNLRTRSGYIRTFHSSLSLVADTNILVLILVYIESFHCFYFIFIHHSTKYCIYTVFLPFLATFNIVTSRLLHLIYCLSKTIQECGKSSYSNKNQCRD